MALTGFSIIKNGPAAGLVWVDFKAIQIHGQKGTPEYVYALQQKAALVDKFIKGELSRGTKHYNLHMKELKTPAEILSSYAREGGFAVDILKDKNVREKFDLLAKEYGVDEARIIRGSR